MSSQESTVQNPVPERAPKPPPMAEEQLIGKSIGRYRILRRLGRGGMGLVYEAEDALLLRQRTVYELGLQAVARAQGPPLDGAADRRRVAQGAAAAAAGSQQEGESETRQGTNLPVQHDLVSVSTAKGPPERPADYGRGVRGA